MKSLILLHGALGAASQLEQLQSALSTHFHVFSMDFDGHGKKAMDDNQYSIGLFAANLLDFIQQNQLVKPLVFGYSMGGYVALKVESMHPNTFEKIVTLGTKFDWTPESSAKEVKMLNPELIEEKVPRFAESLASLHGTENWKAVMHRTAQMMLQLGEEPALSFPSISTISIPVVLLRGSEDKMVSSEETEAVQAHLAQSMYAELENTVHPIDQINKQDLAKALLHFLAFDFSNAL